MAVVKAPAVQVTVGARVYHLGHGDIVPDGVDEATVKRLTDEGFIGDEESTDEGGKRRAKADK